MISTFAAALSPLNTPLLQAEGCKGIKILLLTIMPYRQMSPSLELGVKSSNKAIADRLDQIKVYESVIVAGVYYSL